MKTISSAQTVFYKVLLPIVWIAGPGFGTVSMWLCSLPDMGCTPTDPVVRLQILIVFIAGVVLILWSFAGLKQVRLDDTRLYVSNLRHEVEVPFNNIVKVTENRLLIWHPVTIHFRIPTRFGQTITFVPAMHLLDLVRSHPVVAELRMLAGITTDARR